MPPTAPPCATFHRRPAESMTPRAPRLEYHTDATTALSDEVLAIVRLSTPVCASPSDVLTVDVGLEPVQGAVPAAVWRASGPVTRGRSGMIRYAHDAGFLFGVIEAHEVAYGDIRRTARTVYGAIDEFQRASGFPHLIRMWNFLDALNDGAGDFERYRQFCVGRAEGFGESVRNGYPAATAIGRQRSSGVLQVFWIAAKAPGRAIENPRQVSAYRYPRVHGPVSPGFSRATILQDGTLLISGTASIVGHVSKHPNDARAQLAETLRNLDALTCHAREHGAIPSEQAECLLTVYVRRPVDLALISTDAREAFPSAQLMFVGADICRRELLVEIECIVQAQR